MVLSIAIPALRRLSRTVRKRASQNVVHHQLFLVTLISCEASAVEREDRTTQTITQGVVEEADSRARLGSILTRVIQLVSVRLNSVLRLWKHGIHIPAFANHQNARVDLIQCSTNLLHRLEIMNAHEIEAEAIYLVVLGPVGHRVNDVVADHGTLGSSVVAHTRVTRHLAVSGVAEVIARNNLAERMLRGVKHVVVHHIHHHTQAGIVNALDHFLGFLDAGCRVSSIRRVRTLRNVVVLRVVTPVVVGIVQCLRLIDGCVVEEWLQLNMSDTQLLQVVNTGRLASSILRTRLHEAQISSALGLIHTRGWGLSEVANMGFSDDGIAIPTFKGRHALKASNILLVVSQHHRAVTIHRGSGSVRVFRLVGRAVSKVNCVIISSVLHIAGHSDAPHALVTTNHRVSLGQRRISRLVGRISAQVHSRSGWSPQLESRFLRRVVRTEVVARISVLLIELLRAHDRTCGGGNLAVIRNLDGVLGVRFELISSGDLKR